MIVVCAVLALSLGGNDVVSSVDLSTFPSCGEAALYVVARLKGRTVTIEDLQSRMGGERVRLRTFAQLLSASRAIRMPVIAARITGEELLASPYPLIAHLRRGIIYGEGEPHFLVILAANERQVTCLDPPLPVAHLPFSIFESYWTGNVLLFPDTERQAQRLRGSLLSSRTHFLTWMALGVCTAVASAAGIRLLQFAWRR